MISPEQIDKYFKQQCSPEEADEIDRYLQAHPDLVYEYLDQVEVQSFDMPSANQSEGLWHKVYGRTLWGRKVRSGLKKMAVAASFLLLIGLGIYWYATQSAKSGRPAIAETAGNDLYVFKENKSGNIVAFRLQDGSYIKLMPLSSIRFLKKIIDKRDFYLTGEARFFVAKDAARPFTVYSGDIATTALGTEFQVKMDASKIKVALFEGKVVVKTTTTSIKGIYDTAYLQPGDQVVFDRQKKLLRLCPQTAVPGLVQPEKSGIHQASPVMKGRNWYMFNNQSLTEVLNQLQLIYGQKIYYTASDLKGMTFIGRLDRTDSLHKVLQSIALLNKLKVYPTGDGYRITR